MRILLVEDSQSLQASISEGLRRSGYAVDVSGDGKQGLLHAQGRSYDVIILDIMLPGLDGLSVLRRLRDAKVATHVLLLTARDTVPDRVLGLRSGADDYLVKPFDFDELLARVQALARRAHGARSATITVGPLTIDSAARTVRVLDRPVDLTPREFALLEYLAHRAGAPVRRSELEEHLYDERSQVMSNAVDSAVYSLRARLAAAQCPPLIRTRRGFGYMLRAEAP